MKFEIFKPHALFEQGKVSMQGDSIFPAMGEATIHDRLFVVADGMGVSYEEVYGVASFYSQFTLNPKGEVNISVCLGTACYVKGSGDVIKKISEVLDLEAGSTSPDGKFSLEATRCIGACGLAPVMMVNNEVYGRLQPSQVEGILAKYR